MENRDLRGFRFGIEHEFPLLKDGEFADFSNIGYVDLDRIIADLPVFESDYPGLRVGDIGIRSKRWYAEGFERFDERGEFTSYVVKGVEVRTPICGSIEEAVSTLERDLATWESAAAKSGFASAQVAFNPFKTTYAPDPPLNEWERKNLSDLGEDRVFLHLLTYGPDLNLSMPDLGPQKLVDIGRKLTHYSPYIVPWSFRSPFFDGKLWGGYSYRTKYRSTFRPSVKVYLETEAGLPTPLPAFAEIARMPAEVGRIEFKAFDMISDLGLYRSLFALLLGLCLDETLPGRADEPDPVLHASSASEGFRNDTIHEASRAVLEAAAAAVPRSLARVLEPLREMLEGRQTPADGMIAAHERGEDIMSIIQKHE